MPNHSTTASSERYTFGKHERLSGRTLIDSLFEHGRTIVHFPLKVVWKQAEFKSGFPAKAGIGIPKKNIRKAVDRNLLKRRIREAYRCHKYILYEGLNRNGIQIVLMIVYMDKTITDFRDLEKKIIISLHDIVNEYEKHL
ncbi:MAG: ribonuclease P protein component [Bacteroidia bacterium]|nr:ribonuclease P protein component [Bacteroidia bacterium]